MTMEATPKGLRLHIGIFGRRNVGKSSLLNAITRQQVSIVSEQAGTTTDPVEKPMELLPLGPVLFIDTAGIDDSGALGELRVAKTRAALDRTELGVLVAEPGVWGEFEEGLLKELLDRKLPVVTVFNKSDLGRPPAELLARLAAAGVKVVATVAGKGRASLISAPPCCPRRPTTSSTTRRSWATWSARASWRCWWSRSTRRRPRAV
jgi:small GTP-binding protein